MRVWTKKMYFWKKTWWDNQSRMRRLRWFGRRTYNDCRKWYRRRTRRFNNWKPRFSSWKSPTRTNSSYWNNNTAYNWGKRKMRLWGWENNSSTVDGSSPRKLISFHMINSTTPTSSGNSRTKAKRTSTNGSKGSPHSWTTSKSKTKTSKLDWTKPKTNMKTINNYGTSNRPSKNSWQKNRNSSSKSTKPSL